MKMLLMILALFARQSVFGADYKLGRDVIVRSKDNANIPYNPGNADYEAYLDWLTAGNVPDPQDAAPIPTDTKDQIILREIAAELKKISANTGKVVAP
jgi:hypothetical protein